MSTTMTEVKLTAKQQEQVESLHPGDGHEFTVLGQVFIADHPRAGTMLCYQLNREQYDIIARAITRALKLRHGNA